MSKRVSPAERLRMEIDGVFARWRGLSGAIERVAQLGARLLLQSALQAEVAAFLSRDRYERTAAGKDRRAGMRNGYCPTTVKTTAGPITLARPKLRSTTERFASRLFGTGVTKTNALESLVIAGFVRGLSTQRCGGGVDRGARRASGGVEVDGVAHLRRYRRYQGAVRHLVPAPAR